MTTLVPKDTDHRESLFDSFVKISKFGSDANTMTEPYFVVYPYLQIRKTWPYKYNFIIKYVLVVNQSYL